MNGYHKLSTRLAAVACLCVVASQTARAQPLLQRERHECLQSVTRVGDTVFATTESGFFKAKVNEQVWNRLEIPKEIAPGGDFGEVKDGSGDAIYRSCRNSEPPRDNVNKASGGIFISNDLGETWRKILDCNCDGPILLNTDGTLYVANAIVDERFMLLAMSEDGGLTWKDIRNGIWASISAFSNDPEHDNLICVHTYGPIRGYVWQAEDRNYVWTEYRETQWYDRIKHHRNPFRRSYGTQNFGYMLPATLDNYFDYDFGERVRIPGLTIAADNTQYEFEAGGPMVVPVEILFRENLQARFPGRDAARRPRKPTKVVLIDEPTGKLWGIRVRGNGALFAKGGTLQREMLAARSPTGVGHWVAQKRKELLLTQYVVDAETPLHRSFDLSEYQEFSTAGTYEVQFSYSSSPIADRDFEWSGHFNSRVVTVVIRDSQ